MSDGEQSAWHEEMEPTNYQGIPLCPNCPHTWHGLECNIWCDCPTSCRNLHRPEDDDG